MVIGHSWLWPWLVGCVKKSKISQTTFLFWYVLGLWYQRTVPKNWTIPTKIEWLQPLFSFGPFKRVKRLKNGSKNLIFKNWLDTRPKMETHDPNVYPTILGGVSRGFWTPFLNRGARSAIFWPVKTGTFGRVSSHFWKIAYFRSFWSRFSPKKGPKLKSGCAHSILVEIDQFFGRENFSEKSWKSRRERDIINQKEKGIFFSKNLDNQEPFFFAFLSLTFYILQMLLWILFCFLYLLLFSDFHFWSISNFVFCIMFSKNSL